MELESWKLNAGELLGSRHVDCSRDMRSVTTHGVIMSLVNECIEPSMMFASLNEMAEQLHLDIINGEFYLGDRSMHGWLPTGLRAQPVSPTVHRREDEMVS